MEATAPIVHECDQTRVHFELEAAAEGCTRIVCYCKHGRIVDICEADMTRRSQKRWFRSLMRSCERNRTPLKSR